MPPKDTENAHDEPAPQDARIYRDEAARCRRLGAGINNAQVRASLDARAADFDAKALAAEGMR